MIEISIQKEDFGDEILQASEIDPKSVPPVGACVSFMGVVRQDPENPIDHMEIEHYPGMSERALSKYADEARERWALSRVRILHRVGLLRPSERIMFVAVQSSHREAAFEGASFLMDYLKSRAPFWKKEVRNGAGEWVAPREEDEKMLMRWHKEPSA